LSRSLFYSLALLVLITDQLSKRWVSGLFQPGDSRDLVPGFFSLTYVRNTGGAFGILPAGTLALAGAALLAAGAIVAYVSRLKAPLPPLLAIALALPLGGALGNFVDRVRLRYVVDFFDVHVGFHQWPVFNVADSAICVGVALLAFYFWRQPLAPAPTVPPSFPLEH